MLASCENCQRAQLQKLRAIALLVSYFLRLKRIISVDCRRRCSLLGELALFLGFVTLLAGEESKARGDEKKNERRREPQSRPPHDAPGLLRLALRLGFAPLRLGFARLRVSDIFQALSLDVPSTRVFAFARLDEIELQGGGQRRLIWLGCNPFSRQRDVGRGKKPAIRRLAHLFPFGRKAQIARALAEPVSIDGQRGREIRQPLAEPGTGKFRFAVKVDVLERGELGRRAFAVERATEHGQDALSAFDGALDLPSAPLRGERRRGGDEHDRVAVADESEKPLFPFLAARNRAVDKGLEALELQGRVELVREGRDRRGCMK